MTASFDKAVIEAAFGSKPKLVITNKVDLENEKNIASNVVPLYVYDIICR